MSFRFPVPFLAIALYSALPAAAAPAANDGVAWRDTIAAAVVAARDHNLAKAEQLFQQAGQIAEHFGAGDARNGTTQNSLGLVYKEEKKWAEAEKSFTRAYAILEKAYGGDSLDVGNVSYNIASVMLAQGHYDAAVPYIQKCRVIYEKVLGKTSLKTASVLCMSGQVYLGQKKYADAESALKECADLRESTGGVDNPNLAEALYNLGLVYEREGKFALADTRLKLAEKIREVTFGVTSPEFAEALEAHAALLKQMGRDKDAAHDEAMAAAIRRHGK